MKKEEQSEMKKLGSKLSKLFDLYPIDLGESKKINSAMRESLARMFGDTNYRLFLENSIKFANQNLLRSTTLDQNIYYKSRIETLLQLLNMGKQHFVHYEMIRTSVDKKKQFQKVDEELKNFKNK